MSMKIKNIMIELITLFIIINIFDKYVLSYKVGYRKPSPLIFLDALRKAKTAPFNCIYIDDIPEFVYVARFMGIKAIKYEGFERLLHDLKNIGTLRAAIDIGF